LVVGEVRGPEVVDLLMALNTGHEGGCGTVHANGADDVPVRLESLALAVGLPRPAIHAQIASGLDAVIHVQRDVDGQRKVVEIAVVRCSADGSVTTIPAWLVRDGAVEVGPGQAHLESRLVSP